VQRAELSIDPQEAEKLADSGLKDTGYSWTRMPRTEPWAAEIAVTRARAYRILGDRDKAQESLDIARSIRPSYPTIYTVMSLLHFDEEAYDKAIEVLQMGNEATGGRSAEINYFLGLSYLNADRLEEARKQADIARSLGYPLDGLARKIAEREQGQTEMDTE
jgi:tetratricopeptide (TPR) repeat protein